MTDDDVRARAKERVGDLDPALSREERDARFRKAINREPGTAQPNMSPQEVHTALSNPIIPEIRQLWQEDLQAHPPAE